MAIIFSTDSKKVVKLKKRMTKINKKLDKFKISYLKGDVVDEKEIISLENELNIIKHKLKYSN